MPSWDDDTKRSMGVMEIIARARTAYDGWQAQREEEVQLAMDIGTCQSCGAYHDLLTTKSKPCHCGGHIG